jgi:formylmethanofuran dehydrogenase subunit B
MMQQSEPSTGGTRTYTDIACTVCGCVCDDLSLTVADGRIIATENACRLSEPWFHEQESASPPAAAIRNQPVEYAAAVNEAAKILTDAHCPVVYGLSRSSTEGQRAAVALCEEIGGSIDTTASHCHAHSVMALQDVGEQTCTLGEVRHRADLVIYWGCDPAESHPRHMDRYSLNRPGEFVPRGRADRRMIVIDVKPTETSADADLFLRIEQDSDFELIWALRAAVRGMEPTSKGPVAGLPFESVRQLAEQLKNCRFGVVFFGLGLSMRGIGHLNVAALLSLVRDLNDHTRFYARRMRLVGDVTGADCLLTWQTGYPFSVNFALGFPRYNPGEFSAHDLLLRGQADALLLVGSEGLENFGPAAMQRVSEIPVIALDYPTVASLGSPTVRFTTAVYGIHAPGTAYRMDDVPVPLRAVLPPRYRCDHEVLADVHAAVRGNLGRREG